MESVFRIETQVSFRVIGYSIKTTNKKGEGRKAIPSLWNQFKEENLSANLMPLMNKKPYGLFGINLYNIEEEDSRVFKYFIAVSSDFDVPEKMDVYTVPALTWAVFPCNLETIGKTESMAITKWLPRSKYKPLNKGYITGRMKSQAPDIEYYGKDGNIEVWIAVVEK